MTEETQNTVQFQGWEYEGKTRYDPVDWYNRVSDLPIEDRANLLDVMWSDIQSVMDHPYNRQRPG